MKNLLQYLLTYSLILFMVSVSLPSFGQDGTPTDGPPTVTKEIRDGDAVGDGCHLKKDGKDHDLHISISYSDPTFNTCLLYVGYQSTDQPYVYHPIKVTQLTNSYYASMTIPFTAEDIAQRCEDGNFEFNIDLHCLVDGTFIQLSGTDNSPLKICCKEFDDQVLDREGVEGFQEAPFKANLDNDIFELDETKNAGEKAFIDYYLYDLHGNHIKTLKNIPTPNGIQEIVTSLAIRSGIYFVRYMDNDKIQTKKVFKE